MKAFIEPAGKLTGWWPLSGSDDPGSALIANHTLRSLQLAEMREAGLDRSDTAEDAGVFLRAHAWVFREDWERFLNEPESGSLVSSDGTVLATRKASSAAVEARESFALLHPWDFLRLNERIVGALTTPRIDGELSPHAHLDGVLVLGKGSRVLPGVVIEGNVVVGENCKIGPNCHLRGSTAIGDKCHVGQAVEIKNSILGPGTNVGHLSYVGDSVLGAKVNFGAGTIVSNLRHDGRTHRTQVGGGLVDTGRRKFGVVVGDGVHTGINTSIYPGRKIGPGASTRPAAVVQRDLRDGEIL